VLGHAVITLKLTGMKSIVNLNRGTLPVGHCIDSTNGSCDRPARALQAWEAFRRALFVWDGTTAGLDALQTPELYLQV
jgi:hypothetical protein